MSKRAHTLIALLMLGGCVTDEPGGIDPGDTGYGGGEPPPPPPPLAWDDEAPQLDCSDAASADMFDLVLDDADVLYNDVGYDATEWKETSYYDYLDDNFLLDEYREALFKPQTLPCRAAQFSSDLDFAMGNPHPVASIIGEAMDIADIPRKLEPIQPAEAATAPQELTDMIGVPVDLKDILKPILAAMDNASYQRTRSEANAPSGVYAFELVDDGYSEIVYGAARDPLDMSLGPSQVYLIDEDGPMSFWDQARVLAYAIEEARTRLIEEFLDEDVFLDMTSPIGRIVITSGKDQKWTDRGEVAFWLDLGGDDTYYHPVATTSEDVPVSIHIDLGGNDTYTYDQTDEGEMIDASVSHWDLLPSDNAGRYQENSYYGPISASNQGRQGSGRFGVALLFDFSGDDTYMSPRLSQGWAHVGVGVLYDATGNDVYLAEEAAQGGAINGLGLLLDVEGNDIYRSYTLSQGFNFLTGVGAAWDGTGDDTWYTNPGLLDREGRAMYFSGDIPFEGNQSYSQGAAYGLRGDRTFTYLSGGLGMLHDVEGDDTYTSSTRAQGFGYWQSSGYLVDGTGSDIYEMGAMGQGSGFMYATGVHLDGGVGDDRYNADLDGTYMLLGAGYEFSAGVFVNESGSQYYRWPIYSGGWASCSGFGIFVDNQGNDTYDADGEGGGYAEEMCDRTTEALALFVDSGGDDDSYEGEWGSRDPDDNSLFGDTAGGGANEHGGAADDHGETGFHADGK